MSKKLPGLSRRAPDIEPGAEPEGGGEAPPLALESRARRRGSDGKDRKPKTAASASEGGRPIPVEVLEPISDDDEARRRVARAREIVRRRENWAMAGGLLPIPVLDVVAIAGVQLAMLAELSAHYGVPFERNLAKSVMATLVGSVLPYVAGAGLAGTLAKSMPLLGWGVGLATISVLAGATTHATGAVFIQHFETGGTFLDFDPVATRAYFRREFEQARKDRRAGQTRGRAK